jgi:hypothetical protein
VRLLAALAAAASVTSTMKIGTYVNRDACDIEVELRRALDPTGTDDGA